MPINGEYVPRVRVQRAYRGVKLLGLIYEELAHELGHLYSTTDLLTAAQWIIDASTDDDPSGAGRAASGRPEYHSQDVFIAMESDAWQVACRERGTDNLSDDRLTRNHNALRRLRRLLGS